MMKSLVEAFVAAESLRDGTRAGSKACKREKIKIRRAHIADVCRKIDAETADERHYGKLTAHKAATVTEPKKAVKTFKVKKFNVASIVKPSDELDMLAYERRCRDEAKQAKDFDDFERLCKAVDEAVEEMEANTMTKEERREAAAEIKARSKKNAKAKAEGVLQFRKGGIWAKRPIKSAKESARWIRMLLDMEDARKAAKAHVDLLPLNKMEREQAAKAEAEFQAWREEMSAKWSTDDDMEARCVYREWLEAKNAKPYFTSEEMAWEITRRRIANAQAVENDINAYYRAKEAAASFCEEFQGAAFILGKDIDVLCEQGCKALFEAIAVRNDVIDTLEAELEDMNDELGKLNISHSWQIHDVVLELQNDCRNERREIKKRLAEARAERRLLAKAVKTARDSVDDTEKALIDARAKVVSKKARKAKEVEGRTYVPLAKPEMKGYRLPSMLLTYAMPKKIKSVKNSVVNEAIKYVKKYKDHENGVISDDKFRGAGDKLQKQIKYMCEMAKAMRDTGVCYEADDSRCQYNSGRQSQLADVIGVPYGSDTDMMLSLDHSMANFFPGIVMEALTLMLDQKKASATIDTIETIVLEILTRNGLYMKYRGKKEDESRIVHYKFWNANNSALKVGKCYMLSDDAYDIAKEASQAGMTDEEFDKIKTTGSDMLKWWSYSTTPSCVMTYKDQPIGVDDVLVVDSIEFNKMFKNILDFRKPDNKKEWQDGVKHDEALVDRTAFDGQLFFMVPIPSQQLRGGMSFKGYGVCCAYEDGTTMIDEIARREGRKIPDTIKDIDGVHREWRKYKVIATKDAWKWASYGISYAEYCERMNKLAEKYPTVNKLYTARIADATEESDRNLTRQSMQQFMFANSKQIAELYERAIRKLDKLRTHDGIIRKIAALDKDEADRNAFEHLIELVPEFLDNKLMKRYVEDVFNRSVAEAAVRPVVDGIYPYICEDPVAFFKIVLWGEDPNKLGLGYLKADEVNIPGTAEGKEMYLVRYPNNYLCGMIGRNHNDDIYRCVGNTMVLSVDGYWLTRADGDVDGDEMCAIFNKVVIEMMKDTIEMLNPPLILFPHASLDKKLYIGFEARAKALAGAMVIANKFGPAVGQNSNLATKFMARAASARMAIMKAVLENDRTAYKSAKGHLDAHLNNAIIAHIAAIIAIDLAKTGTMPAWLENKLKEITKYAGKKMPWNQRFCKDNKSAPWFEGDWDKRTNERTEGIVDKCAGYVIDKTDAYNYEAPTGNGFSFESIMCDKTGLYIQGSEGKLEANSLFAFDARNYMKGNMDGDNETSLISRLHSAEEKDTVGFAELMRFFWRNMAQLMYKISRDDSDDIQNANLVTEYYATVREIMLHFGSHCGSAKFASLTPDQQAKSNVWHAMKIAFGKNSVGNERKKDIVEAVKADNPKASEDELKVLIEEACERDNAYMSAKSSYAIFTVKVFAPDLYRMAAEKKGISDPWQMPAPAVVIKEDDDGAPINSITAEELKDMLDERWIAA